LLRAPSERILAPFEDDGSSTSFSTARLDLTATEDDTRIRRGRRPQARSSRQETGFGGAVSSVTWWTIWKVSLRSREATGHAIGRRKSDNEEIGNAAFGAREEDYAGELFSASLRAAALDALADASAPGCIRRFGKCSPLRCN